MSPSIPRRLLREGRPHLLPVYYTLRLSWLAREAIENSGSRRFADHIYAGRPRGSFFVGTLLDKLLLSLPSSRSFRNRYVHCRDNVARILRASQRPFHRVLSAPCGIPRDLVDAARRLRQEDPSVLQRSTFYCLDADPAALRDAAALIQQHGLPNFQLIEGDALDPQAMPKEIEVLTSTGFTEFLSDADARRFLEICYHCLLPGGSLLTSATVEHKLSSYLLSQIAELSAHYREEDLVGRLFETTPFRNAAFARDSVGYQILITAPR